MFSNVGNQFIDNEIIENISNFSLIEKLKLTGEVKGHETLHLRLHPEEQLLSVQTWSKEYNCLAFIDISKLRLGFSMNITISELKPDYIIRKDLSCHDYLISQPVRSFGCQSASEIVLTLFHEYREGAHFDIGVFSNRCDFEPISNINKIPCRKGYNNEFDVCYPNHLLHTSNNDIIFTDLNSLKEIAEVKVKNEMFFECVTARANNESYLIGSYNGCVYLFDSRTHMIATKVKPFVKHKFIEKLFSLKQNDHLFLETHYEGGIYLVDLRYPKTYVYVAEQSQSLNEYEEPPTIDPVAGIISRYSEPIQYLWSLENGKLLSTPIVTDCEYTVEDFTCSLPCHPMKTILFSGNKYEIDVFAN